MSVHATRFCGDQMAGRLAALNAATRAMRIFGVRPRGIDLRPGEIWPEIQIGAEDVGAIQHEISGVMAISANDAMEFRALFCGVQIVWRTPKKEDRGHG